jgi:hypothetical protein
MARGFEELDIFFTVGNPQPRHQPKGNSFSKQLIVNIY